jgi:hypothetical protein
MVEVRHSLVLKQELTRGLDDQEPVRLKHPTSVALVHLHGGIDGIEELWVEEGILAGSYSGHGVDPIFVEPNCSPIRTLVKMRKGEEFNP